MTDTGPPYLSADEVHAQLDPDTARALMAQRGIPPRDSRGGISAQFVEGDSRAIVVGLGLAVCSDILRHLELLERFQVGHAHHDRGELAATRR